MAPPAKPAATKPEPPSEPTSKPKAAAKPGPKTDTNSESVAERAEAVEKRKAEAKARREKADWLYEQCLEKQDISYIWSLERLNQMSGVKGDETIELCNVLLGSQLFQATTIDDIARGTSDSAFRIRTRFAAQKYKSIPDGDAREVYRHIEDVGATGAYKTVLRRKLKLTDARVEKILRGLTASKHIKQLNNARANAKKTYLLYETKPGKDLIGGAWHDGGQLDEAMIEEIAKIVTGWIKERSWVLGPLKPSDEAQNSRKRMRDDEEDSQAVASAESKKRKPDTRSSGSAGKATGVAKVSSQTNAVTSKPDPPQPDPLEIAASSAESRATLNNHILLPYPPGYLFYPTVGSITDSLNISGLIPEVTVSTADMRELFRVLIASGRIERIGSQPKRNYTSEDNSEEGSIIKREDEDDAKEIEAEERAERENELMMEAASEGVQPGHEGLYRWVRRPDWEAELDNAKTEDVLGEDDGSGDSREGKGLGTGNGLSEVPCSKCPVSIICTPDGPVSAVECEYLDKWLGSKIKDDDW